MMSSSQPWNQPSPELQRIGLLRLRVALPQYWPQLKDASVCGELAETYALACLFLEHLRTDPQPKSWLIAEYELQCHEILQDITTMRKRRAGRLFSLCR